MQITTGRLIQQDLERKIITLSAVPIENYAENMLSANPENPASIKENSLLEWKNPRMNGKISRRNCCQKLLIFWTIGIIATSYSS
jgi:hypothetical protein